MVILAAALGLAGCQGGEKTAGAEGGDKYAGLDQAIRGWHAEIKDGDAQCKGKAEGEKCRDFQVACKGEREVGADEAAKGMSAKVAVAMGWEGWDASTQRANSFSSSGARLRRAVERTVVIAWSTSSSKKCSATSRPRS